MHGLNNEGGLSIDEQQFSKSDQQPGRQELDSSWSQRDDVEATAGMMGKGVVAHEASVGAVTTAADVETPPNRVLGVFGLSSITKESDLEHLYAKYGVLEKVALIYDHSSRQSKGFAFITYKCTQKPPSNDDALKVTGVHRDEAAASEVSADLEDPSSNNDNDNISFAEALESANRAKAATNGMQLHGKFIRVDYSRTNSGHSKTPGEYRGPRWKAVNLRGGSSPARPPASFCLDPGVHGHHRDPFIDRQVRDRPGTSFYGDHYQRLSYHADPRDAYPRDPQRRRRYQDDGCPPAWEAYQQHENAYRLGHGYRLANNDYHRADMEYGRGKDYCRDGAYHRALRYHRNADDADYHGRYYDEPRHQHPRHPDASQQACRRRAESYDRTSRRSSPAIRSRSPIWR